MYRTLRDFLSALEKAGELHRVQAEVSPILEVSAIADLHSKQACAAVSHAAAQFDPQHANLGGKALLFDVAPDLVEQPMEGQRAHADRIAALHLLDPRNMLRPRALQPLPVLGVPGWWPGAERESFYDDTDYFRPGRQSDI